MSIGTTIREWQKSKAKVKQARQRPSLEEEKLEEKKALLEPNGRTLARSN